MKIKTLITVFGIINTGILPSAASTNQISFIPPKNQDITNLTPNTNRLFEIFDNNKKIEPKNASTKATEMALLDCLNFDKLVCDTMVTLYNQIIKEKENEKRKLEQGLLKGHKTIMQYEKDFISLIKTAFIIKNQDDIKDKLINEIKSRINWISEYKNECQDLKDKKLIRKSNYFYFLKNYSKSVIVNTLHEFINNLENYIQLREKQNENSSKTAIIAAINNISPAPNKWIYSCILKNLGEKDLEIAYLANSARQKSKEVRKYITDKKIIKYLNIFELTAKELENTTTMGEMINLI